MKLLYKPDFERAQQYWDAFWAHEIIDRPCTVIWAKKEQNAPWAPYISDIGGDFEQTLNQFEKFLNSHLFMGEAMAGIRPSFGPDQVAGFLGAPINYSQQNQTSWSEKIVQDWESFDVSVDENSPCWKRMHEYHMAAEQFCKGKCLLYNIDMHVNIDGLEALRGAQNLMFDLIDKPQAVKKALGQMRQSFVEIYNGFHKYAKKDELGTTGLLHMYSRGKFNPIQADFICLLSPDMFREFVLPEIEFEAQFLDNCCFHLDGADSLKHLDDILAIEQIDAIQWIPGAGNKPQLEWPELLHKIQSANKAIILYLTPDEVKQIHGEYDPRLVVYEVHADSPQQGQELLDWLKRNN
jgi:5-methyltetrahydrofolate--homocysteine methyltransferase